MWRTKSALLFVLLLIMTLPSAWAIILAGPSVAYTNNQGSITFPSAAYFNAVYVSASLIQFDLTSALSLNSASRVNMTSTPTKNQEMEISIIDLTEPLAIVAGTITSSSWFSANHTLLVYSATMKHWFQIGAAQNVQTLTQYAISLRLGWNLISLPVVPNSSAVRSVIGPLITKSEVVIVWSYSAASKTWQFFKPPAAGTLTTMVDGRGYWVSMTKADTLYVNGTMIPPAGSPPSYSLVQGWNLVGFKPQPLVRSESVSEYLSSITGQYDANNVWAYDNTSGNWARTGSGYLLQPGQAIWILMTAPATLRP